MTKAIKCNRCGKFQETTSRWPADLSVRAEVKLIIPPDGEYTKTHVEYLDLDEECTKALLDFVGAKVEGI